MLGQTLRAAARCYPFLSGYGTIANSRWFRKGMTQQRQDWVRLRCGAEILAPMDDWVGRTLYYFGDLDPKLSRVFRQILRPGDTVLDVGANIGVMSMLAASLVGPGGAVHSFEPQPQLTSMLRESVSRNGFRNVHIHEYALGDKTETRVLGVHMDNSGWASLESDPSDYIRPVSVKVQEAASCFDSLGISAVRMLKMDVEGYEPVILRAAMPFLERIKPHAVLFEITNHDLSFNDQPIVQLLAPLGYRFLDIPRSYVRLKLQAPPTHHYAHDILALRA